MPGWRSVARVTVCRDGTEPTRACDLMRSAPYHRHRTQPAMQIANCPSCGAAVKFQSAASVLAVCEYCASTLLRRGAVLEDIGKMASLMDDPTLIRVGSEGGYKGARFAVIGRLQMRYEAGLWNEWHILFDDMRTGWLGESAGEFFVTFERQVDLKK